MKKVTLIMLFVGAFLLTAINASAQTHWKGKSIDDFYHYVGPDIDMQFGYGYHWDTANKAHDTDIGMGRFRAGVMWIPSYPWFFSVGATVEANSYTGLVWGGQAEALHLASGIWLRSGGGFDYQAHPHFNVGLGWSFFGAEVHSFSTGPFDNREGVAFMGTLRVPIGYLLYVFNKN